MSTEPFTRRLFLKSSGALAGNALLRAGGPALVALSQAACEARDEEKPFDHLSATVARELDAIAARILPTTDTPGAREAGVIYFIDTALGSLMPDLAPHVDSGLAEFQSGIEDAFPGAGAFSDLSEADQDGYLRSRQDTEFFGLMRDLTVAGFFGMSRYGGNRDDIGWKHVGMDGPPHAWQPPFGYYDAEYVEGEADGD